MEVAAESGVRGRTRGRDVEAEDEAKTETAAVKRRKVEEDVGGESRTIDSSPCIVELMNRDGIAKRDSARETSVVVVGRTSSAEDQCQIPRTEDEQGGASVSCCSSNGSSNKVDGRIEFLDLERGNGAEAGTSSMHYYSCNTRSEMSLCCDRREGSDGMDSAAAEVEVCNVAESRSRNTANDNINMTVTEAELEEFFTAAEKDLRSKIFECSRKYNFDFVKEEPLEGRYAWVRLKP